jgi:hypothetical protein
VANLQKYRSVSQELALGLRKKLPDDVKAIHSTIERNLGFVGRYLRAQSPDLGLSDVGQIRYDHVHRLRQRIKKIPLEENDSFLHSVGAAVGAGDVKRCIGDIDRVDCSVRKVRRQGDGDSSAPGANVRDEARYGEQPGRDLDGVLNQQLGLGAWYQYRRGDVQVQAIELFVSRYIGGWLPVQAPLDEPGERCPLNLVQHPVQVGIQIGAIDSKDMPQEDFSLQPGVVYSVGGKNPLGAIDSLADGYPTLASSFFAWSAAATASMMSSRSPSRTDSRLCSVKPIR